MRSGDITSYPVADKQITPHDVRPPLLNLHPIRDKTDIENNEPRDTQAGEMRDV